MIDPFLIIAVEATAIIILSIELASEKIQNYKIQLLANKALDAQESTEKRMREVSKIHIQLLERPVNVSLPPNFVDSLGQALVHYLDGVGGALPPIIPPSKDPS